MRSAAILVTLALLAACSSEQPEPREPAPTFAESPYRYCMTKNDRWLINIMDLIQANMPADYDPTSLRYKELRVSDYWMEKVIDRSRKEILIRFTASRAGQEAKLMALAEITPATCEVGPIEVSVGWDRFIDRGKQSFRAK
jgi:hypothetical protein